MRRRQRRYGRATRLAAEDQRRRIERVVDEHQNANQQNDHLQRDLPVGAHQERLACLVERTRREVSLDLTLVGAKVRAEQKQRGDCSRPERVLVGEVEREIEATQSASRCGDRQPVARLTPSGRPRIAVAMITRRPPTMSDIVLMSVQVTACTPPNIV